MGRKKKVETNDEEKKKQQMAKIGVKTEDTLTPQEQEIKRLINLGKK